MCALELFAALQSAPTLLAGLHTFIPTGSKRVKCHQPATCVCSPCCAPLESPPTFVGLARTKYIRCIHGIFGREITKYTVIYAVYIRFWPTRDCAIDPGPGNYSMCRRGNVSRQCIQAIDPCAIDPCAIDLGN